jgi:hypothetical protein
VVSRLILQLNKAAVIKGFRRSARLSKGSEVISEKIDAEVESLWRYIRRSVDRILLCLDGLDEEDLNWRPLNNANSLYVLAVHMMGNIEANVVGVLCHEQVNRQREDEFKARGSATGPILQKWNELQETVSAHLAQLPPGALDLGYEHPRRGKVTGRDLLIVIARHAAEHVGHAELTRDLLFTTRGRELPKRDF